MSRYQCVSRIYSATYPGIGRLDQPGNSRRVFVDDSVPKATDTDDEESELRQKRAPRVRLTRFPRVETPAVLRAVAIVLIVATHADLIDVKGGAHLLLAVAGYNLARFQLADVPGATRVRRLLRGAIQIAVPAILWIGVVSFLSGKYTWTTALLVNNMVPGDGRWNEQWQFWFLEAALWTMVGLAALFAVRPIDRLRAAASLGFRDRVPRRRARSPIRAGRRRSRRCRTLRGGHRALLPRARLGCSPRRHDGETSWGVSRGCRGHGRILRRSPA